MNDSPEPDTIFCPSCGASVAERADRGAPLQCPVCGTEFLYEPGKSSESSIADSDAARGVPAKRKSTEEILLDRLTHEPPGKRPVPIRTMAAIALAIVVIAFGVFKITSHPDAYAPGHEADTSVTAQKQAFFEHIVDSLQAEIAKNPANINLHLRLADADYDAGKWNDSRHEFEMYLAEKPRDADARVDYSYALAQATGSVPLGISELDTALMFDPNHLNALINAGIMTAQTITDSNHAEALAKSKEYFERARNVAAKTDPAVALRIDTLIMAIDSTGLRMKMK